MNNKIFVVMSKNKIIALVVVAVVILLAFLFLLRPETTVSYKLTTVTPQLGTIINSVSATGTVEPIDQVEVGTQVSGVIQKINVDFNSQVKKGQVLAILDKSTLQAKKLQIQASLESAQNELDYQTKNYDRINQLFESEMVSETEYESALYQFNNARTSVMRLKSELEQAEVNLSYATIYSPIDGVVLDRSVEEGQTVAASFSTPTLFTIARDLTQMQVEADVDEADIGQVFNGQRVVFTVDAYPDSEFSGVITQIRLSPVVTSNVVTYTVIIDAPNPNYKLKPGLTATISIITNEVKDVMTIPVSALNFSPETALKSQFKLELLLSSGMGEHPQKLNETGAGMVSSGFNQSVASKLNGKNAERPVMLGSVVWLKKGNSLIQCRVETGATDRAVIQVLNGIQTGDSIVTFAEVGSVSEKENTSPFMPRGPGRK